MTRAYVLKCLLVILQLLISQFIWRYVVLYNTLSSSVLLKQGMHGIVEAEKFKSCPVIKC
jgi:hypothetical protein